jgi:endonuclease-3
MKSKEICQKLDVMIPNPHCELIYNKDYELLIAVMLSAQCTDKRVNIVTKTLFSKYDLKGLSKLDLKLLEKELYSLGSASKKAYYLKEIATSLLKDFDGKVPNNRKYLESLPGVGHKTCNVVLAELFNENTFAVDTHVSRVAKRLDIASENDNVLEIERKLEIFFKNQSFHRLHHQLVLFGRYICTAKNPKCNECLIKCKNEEL